MFEEAVKPPLLLVGLFCTFPQLEGRVRLSTRRFGQPPVVQVPMMTKTMPVVPPGCISMQDILEVLFPTWGLIVKALTPPFIVMFVAVQEAEAVKVAAVELGVPEPMIVIPMLLGTTIPLAQVQDPDGILMMSPSTAVCVGPLMIALTSTWLQEAAVKLPCACKNGHVKSKIRAMKDNDKMTLGKWVLALVGLVVIVGFVMVTWP